MDETGFREELERLRSDAAELAFGELNRLMLKNALVGGDPDRGIRLSATPARPLRRYARPRAYRMTPPHTIERAWV